MPTTGLHRLAACAVITGAALILYWPATRAWFFQDDFQWLAGTLTFQPSTLLDLSSHQHFYRPVISLYFWAATPVFGGSPVLFHWANHFLHAANALLVFLLASATGFRLGLAFFAAICFLSIPAYIEALTWISALAEPVTTFFGLISVYALLIRRRGGSPAWTAVSVGGFLFALATHESAVVLLPLLVLADWAFAGDPLEDAQPRWRRLGALSRRFAPHGVILFAYLLIDLSVNARSYLVEEGHYRPGLHVIPNLLRYAVMLYAGKRDLVSLIMAGVVLTVLLLRGTRRVVFATAWLVLSILPFALFAWSPTSRYAYMPAVGMALLLAEGLGWIDRRAKPLMNRRARAVVVSAVGAFVAIRFMLFAAENIRHFSEATDRYREFAVMVRQRHPDPAPGTRIPVDAATADALQFRYLEALVQWEFRDPTLTLVVEP
jgi:hypothetical protein